MTDFALARKNMVDCQIHPSGVVDELILDVFNKIPREDFVPQSLQKIAYNDENTPLGNGRYLLEPTLHARMLQALAPQKTDRVLDLGTATGYSAALFACLCAEVTVEEPDTALFKQAEALWARLGLNNISTKLEGVFDIIFINGAVAEVPTPLLSRLSPKGRLIALLKPAGAVLGDVILTKVSGVQKFSSHALFEAGCPYLPGFEPRPSFVF